MADVVWRPQALRDLEAAESYYLEVAPDYASVFVAGAFAATERLRTHPESPRGLRTAAQALRFVALHRRSSRYGCFGRLAQHSLARSRLGADFPDRS